MFLLQQREQQQLLFRVLLIASYKCETEALQVLSPDVFLTRGQNGGEAHMQMGSLSTGTGTLHITLVSVEQKASV